MARVLTPEKIDRAISLRRKSWSLAEIATDLGASVGAVRWQLLRNGEVDPPRPTARFPMVPIRPKTLVIGGRRVRRFTREEDARLLELESQGLGLSEIARRLGRKHNSVIGRLMTLAHHDSRKECAS
jgi:IS30 family transposase